MKQVSFFANTPTELTVCVDENAKDRLSASILNREEGVFSEAKFLYSISPAGAALLDIGANVGLFSLFFASNHRPVWAIEAAPTNAALLREGAAVSGFENLSVHNVAVSDQEGVLEFVENGPFGSIDNAVMLKSDRQVTTTVSSVVVDQWPDAKSIPKNLIIKIDIEGHEVHAICGMRRFLKDRDLPRLFIESNSYCLGFFYHTSNDLIRELEAIGYSVYRYESEHALRPWNSKEFQAIFVQNMIAIGPNDDRKNLPPFVEPRSKSQRLIEIQQCAKAPRPYLRAVLGGTMQHFPLLSKDPDIAAVLERLRDDDDQDVRESVSWFDPFAASDTVLLDSATARAEDASRALQYVELNVREKVNLASDASSEEGNSGWSRIRGEITYRELKAIESVAKLVPPNGVIVEVGSYLGRSSWTWAKSAHPSVSVYCLDPWDGYRGSSLQEFKKNVRDCENITPMQGYSPKDFSSWDVPIDLYFEDAVHKNPILRENIAFWTSFLKPNGIICGHDYIKKFQDVIDEAHAWARKMDYRLFHVESFWCLLPEQAFRIMNVVGTLEKLEQDIIRAFEHEISTEHESYKIRQGEALSIQGTVKNATKESWPIDAGVYSVKVGARVFSSPTGKKVLEGRTTLQIQNLPSGATVAFDMSVETKTLAPGEYRVRLDLVVDYMFWFENKGAKAVEVSLAIDE